MNSALTLGLLDAELMRACLRGHPPATRFFIALNQSGAAQLCRITILELLSGCASDAERALARRYVGTMQVLELTAPIARRASDLLDAISLPTALTASDSIIAATALEHGVPLYTLSPVRFAGVPSLVATLPY